MEIKFKDKYFEAIVNGSKTQTMRMPHKRLEVNEGELAVAIFPTHPSLNLRITKVGYKYFKSINDADAKREGFESADELKAELKEIYNIYQIFDTSRFYYYRFEVIGEDL